MRVHVRVCVRECVCMCMCMYVCVCVSTYIRTVQRIQGHENKVGEGREQGRGRVVEQTNFKLMNEYAHYILNTF